MDDLHVHIRAMVEDDRSLVFTLAEEVLRPLAEASGHPELFHEEEFLAMMERGEVWIADTPHEPAEMAGYVIVEAESDCLTVRCLCVSPAFEGQHVGHRLVDWAEGLAYHRSAARLLAPLPVGDKWSRQLYSSHSFAPLPEQDRPEVIVMEKRLR